jgi:P2-related tail formation protein
VTTSLLPSNSTPLERALEQALIPGEDLRQAIALVRAAKELAPDDWLYFLVWEYGLDELLPYLPDPRQALERGLIWQRIRGTPNSIRLALSWIGLQAITLYEERAGRVHWYEFQIDPGEFPDRVMLKNLVGLCRVSKPVRSRISRVFHGYDIRHAEHDGSRFEHCLYDRDSGVYDPENDVVVSLARYGDSAVSYDQPEFFVSHLTESGATLYYDDYRHDWVKFDGVLTQVFASNGIREVLVVGQGVGANLLIADGTLIANGQHLANGMADESSQPESWGLSISA